MLVNIDTFPTLTSWLPIAADSDFPLQNLPFGIFSPSASASPRVGVALGDQVIDLSALLELGFMDEVYFKDPSVFYEQTLNDFIGLGQDTWRAVRLRLVELFRADNPTLRDNEAAKAAVLFDQNKVKMHLPVHIGDYTDFYSSIEHASNVGSMFRDPSNPLLPNWRHLPVAYHGRASSIVISGTPIRRPKGQTKPDNVEMPVFGPSQALDFELEMAFVVGKPTQMGQSVAVAEADAHVFGFLLFNDWSARDIQRWEYVPLGPFLAKNFASAVSPWIVTLDALAPFRVATPTQNPPVLPYLQFDGLYNFDIHLEVGIQPENGAETIVTRTNYKYMYWNYAQQLAHHTVNGCNINIGDLYASGTISGAEKGSNGCLLELTWGGKEPITLADGSQRKYLADGDTVAIRGYALKNNHRIGFGEVSNKLLPAAN
ncbi:MAG TPA: fumarylacetoacetase [Microscillaceae bacterium]|jgi:fumarylacetoacetase|nr:fumarylacetoacetase [Microscillaceae bacterium]